MSVSMMLPQETATAVAVNGHAPITVNSCSCGVVAQQSADSGGVWWCPVQ